MNQLLSLEICSSKNGLIIQEWTEFSAVRWQKRTEKRLLRYKRTSQVIRDAIQNNDTIVGWVHSDHNTPEEIKRVFRGYDKYFETRGIL